MEVCLASIFAMIVLEPKNLTASFKNFGFSVIKEFNATLSAPAFKHLSISFKLLIPPPRVIGQNISFVISLIISNKLFLL